MSGPLAGHKVLDFCWIGAGALVTKALAELGADVIRVESRTHPDNLRLAPPFRPGTGGLEASGYFASRNPGKKSFALNMSRPEAREIALQLISKVSVVTSNFRPGVMERWGLSYEEVREVNPEIVYLVMPMQGSDGPHRSFIGFGSTIAALGGLVHLSGVPGRIPVGTGTHYPDHVPNPGHSLVGLLAAILHRARTGEGQRVELSQLESTVNAIGPAVLAASAGSQLAAVGNDAPGVVPRGAYRTADDEWVVVACSSEAQWTALSGVIADDGGDPELRSLPLAEREQQPDRIADAVAGWISKLDREEVLRRLNEFGVPNGAVNTSAELLEDQNLNVRGFWQVVDHPVIGEMPMFSLPFIRDSEPRRPMTRPPLLGEHTWEVASQLLGMERERFDSLVAAEVLY
ncbi:MAG: CaiB/BaiF CoA transferase family protein [Acidimicrobiia bacterium]